jgi:hypothetical protein
VEIRWGTAGSAALSARIKGQWRNGVRNVHPRDGNHIACDLTVYEARLSFLSVNYLTLLDRFRSYVA